jgi:hypothetical protein
VKITPKAPVLKLGSTSEQRKTHWPEATSQT